MICFLVLRADAIELVADINQEGVSWPQFSGYYGATEIPQGTFLIMSDSSHGLELWFTDHTPQGTRLVKDIYPGWGSGAPSSFIRFGDIVVFLANDGVHGSEFWRSDGTSVGTYMLADINPGPRPFGGDFPSAVLDGVLYFAADDSVSGNELWRTDGTREGTYLVVD
jgi:ELWxxDGT repeat protein